MRKPNWKVKVNGKGTPVNEMIHKFWISRNIDNPDAFLYPVGNIHPLNAFENIDKAGSVFYMMLQSKAKFLIYADVDADGCSSAAILYHYLTFHGCEAAVYINKKKEHGVKEEFFEHDHGEDIVVVVDSINDTMDMYERIWAQGKQLIILDHHVPNDIIKQNARELNLVSSALNYPNPHLSGSGVTWKFVSYIDKLMKTNCAEQLIDLAAVGIIADVCSIGADSMENREICNIGFRSVNNSGIRSICGTDEMNANTIAYSIAPLVNAANRMNENRLALDLFLSDNTTEAKKIIRDLTKIKDKQKELVGECFPKFDDWVKEQTTDSCYYFIVDDSVGSLGGLLATKAADKWKRPCVVLHDTPEGYAGSMRAVGVENFSAIVNSSGLGECAGHENSAGIVIPKDNLDALKLYVEEALKDVKFTEDVEIDLYIERMQITPLLINQLRQINRIAGPGFPPVTVLIENIKNYTVKKLSQGKHLCVEVPDMKFLSWNFNNWDDVEDNGILSAVGTLDESFFAGKRSTQMIMNDYQFEQIPVTNFLW